MFVSHIIKTKLLTFFVRDVFQIVMQNLMQLQTFHLIERFIFIFFSFFRYR